MFVKTSDRLEHKGFIIIAKETPVDTWIATVQKTSGLPLYYRAIPSSEWSTKEFPNMLAALQDAELAIDSRTLR